MYTEGKSNRLRAMFRSIEMNHLSSDEYNIGSEIVLQKKLLEIIPIQADANFCIVF